MSTQKSSIFYGTLIALSSLVVGMVLAARLDLTPGSFARTALNVPATNSAPLTGPLDATTFRTIAHNASPAVVSLIVRGKQNVPEMNDFFGFQLPGQGQGRRGGRGAQPQPSERPFSGAGSGFIIDGKAGYVLTNNHVVENADEIVIMLKDMKSEDDGLKARVVGRDRLTDSALLQVIETPKEALPEIKFGDSAQIEPGDWVMAIGNPLQFSNTVTVGVVSAVGRVSPELNPVPQRNLEYIQTDAAINRGNSGGPLLNIRGEVVGVNTAIVSGGESPFGGGGGGNIGIGFAVPINIVRDLLPQLRTGKVVRGRIGVELRGVPMALDEAKDFGLSAPMGALVSRVSPDGPAKVAGIQPGDVIYEYNGKQMKDNEELIGAVSRTAPGTSMPLKVMRAGKSVSLSVKVEELNVDTEAAVRTRTPDRPAPEREAPAETGFGMTVEPVTPSMLRQAGAPSGKGGAVVNDMEPLGAAARGGIQEGDIILSINDKSVSSVGDVTRALDAVAVGRTARALVWRADGRSGSELYLTLRKR